MGWTRKSQKTGRQQHRTQNMARCQKHDENRVR